MKTIKNLTADELRKSILQLAIQGKLVKQNPNDEPASELVKKIYEEKKKLIAEGKIKKDKNESYIFKDDDNCYYEKIGNNASIKLEDLPFDIPDNWTWIRFGNLVNISTGASFKKEQAIQENKSNYTRVLRGGNILPFQYLLKNDDLYIPNDLVSNDIILKANDLITPAVTSLENIGKVAVIEKNYDNVTAGGFVYIFRPNFNSNLISNLIMDFMSSSAFQEMMKSITKKSGQAFYNMNKERLKDLYFPLPPLEEQQRIVDKINSFEPLIQEYDKYEKQLTELESTFAEKLKKSILQYAIEGKLVKQDPNDEPASVLLERIKAEKEKLIKEGKIKRDKNESYIYQGDDKNYYENIPKCWDLIRFDVFTIYTSDYVANGSFKSLKENVNFYKIPNYALLVKTQDFSNNFTYDLTYTDKHGYEFLQKCHLYGGELIMSNIGASIGKIMIMPQLNLKCALAPNSILVKCFDTVTTKYLQLFMSSYYGQNILKEFTAGTAMPKFSKTQIRQTIIPVPPYNEQQRIVNKIELINKAID